MLNSNLNTMDDFVGMIKIFAGSTPPPNWAFCDGSLIAVSDNQMLYAIIGTQFGGTVNVNFNLPNLNGNVAIGAGQGPGLSPYTQGQSGGMASVVVNPNQIPAHSHGFFVSTAQASQSAGSIGTVLAGMNAAAGRSRIGLNTYVDIAPDTKLVSGTIAASGQNQAHDNLQPYLAVNFIICVNGMMPSPQ